MNPKLKITPIRHFSEQGFAMPVVMGLGLVMLLIATTLMVRSQGDRVTASTQKATAQSLAVAEGGLSRTLAKLNQSNPDISSLLQRTYDPNGLLGSAVNEWTASNMPPCATTSGLLSGTLGDSSYEVLAYRYDSTNKTGTLLVKGLAPFGTASSESRVQQTFNVSPKPSSVVGVLGTNDIDLGNNDVRGRNGNVACTNTTNCPVPSGSCASLTNDSTNSAARSAIGALGSADIDGKIFLGPTIVPALPTMPTVWNGFGTIPIVAFTVELPNYTSNNTTLVFPRPIDFINHVAGTPYHYKIGTMDANGFNITINTVKNATTNPTGDPVYFWVSGDIDMGGSSQVNHNNTLNPTAFRIYGTSTTSQDILVASGASDVDAFIFAPNARVGINGTGTIDGMVYAKSFGEIGANGNAAVNVPNNHNLVSSLGDLAVYFSFQTDSMNKWQRQAVP